MERLVMCHPDSQDSMQEIRTLIGQISSNKGIRQEEIAHQLSISPEHLSRIKNGRRTPSPALLNKLRNLAKDGDIESTQVRIVVTLNGEILISKTLQGNHIQLDVITD